MAATATAAAPIDPYSNILLKRSVLSHLHHDGKSIKSPTRMPFSPFKTLSLGANTLMGEHEHKPRSKPRRRQTINSITKEPFAMHTLDASSLVIRRQLSQKWQATDREPLLPHTDNDGKPPSTPNNDSIENLHPSSPASFKINATAAIADKDCELLTPTKQDRKRKREMDGIVHRVKSAKLTANTKTLMKKMFDESELDARRFQMRSYAIDVLPMRDELRVASSADAMSRPYAVMKYRQDCYGVATF